MSISGDIELATGTARSEGAPGAGAPDQSALSGRQRIGAALEKWSRNGRDPIQPLKWAFSAILSVVIIGAIASNLLRERESMSAGLADLDHAVIEFLSEYQRVQAAGLEKTLVTLTANNSIFVAFRARNRDGLLQSAEPIFAELNQRHGVTHLSFIDAERVTFLRAHAPEEYGDRINRFTLLTAASTGEVQSGREFGAHGGYTLRVVKPWLLHGELIGFVELGIEIGYFLDTIERSLGVTLVEAYDKSVLDYDHWVALGRSHSRKMHWNASQRYALSANSHTAIPEMIASHIDGDVGEVSERGELFTTVDRAFHMLAIAQSDVSGREVGRLLVLRDITNDILAFLVSQAAIIAIGLALWFAALGIFNRVAVQVQGIVADNESRLDSEVAARTRELEASEHRYREAQRVSNFGNWERNIVTGEIFWSDEVYRIHGVEPGSFTVTREALFGFVHPDDREMLLELVTRSIDARTGYSIEHRIVRADGEVRYVHKKGITEYGKDGSPLRTMGVVHDVTERRRMETALRESEELFSQAFRRSPLLLSMSDPETGTMHDVNDSWLATLGYSREEVVGKPIEELDVWIDPAGRERLVEELKESDSITAIETQFNNKNGDVLDIIMSAGWVNSGGRRMVFACSCDVSEYRRAETALRESERLVSQAFQLSPTLVAMSYCDDGKFCEVNEAWVRALGYARDEAIGHSSTELNLWVDFAHRDEVVAQVERWGSVHSYETQLRNKNGQIVDILFSATLIKRGGRSILFGISNDVTTLRKAEGYGRRLARVMEASLNEIYIFDDTTCRFVHVNPSAQDNLGHTMDELGELAPWDIMPQFDKSQFLEAIEPLRRGEAEVLRLENEHRRKNGSTYAVEVQLQHYDEESPGVFVAIVNDISERKRAEREVAALNQDLELRVEERTEELRVAHQQLLESEKMASLGGLVAGVAHEINTPIGIGVTAASHLHGQSAGLRDKLASGTLRKSELETYFDGCDEWTSILLSNLNRASDLVRSFKNVSVDQLIEDRREVNFISYVNDIVMSLRPKLKHTAIEVVIEGDSELAIDTYPGAISQIVTNLTINSLLHGFDEGATGVIRISASGDGAGVTMLYSDNGRGIAAEHLPKLFEPFFTTRRGQGGSGLGLNVVYNLVTQKLGGTISCQSTYGEGATFTIFLPVLK